MCRQQAASYLGRLISMSLAWAAQPRIQPFARLAIPGIFGGFQEGLPVVQPQLLRWTSAPPLLEAILVVCTHVDIYPLSFQLFPHFSFRFNKAASILLRRRRFETYIRPAFTSWTCGICIFIRYYWTCDYFSGGWLFCLYHLFFFKFSGHILGERRTLLSSCQRCVRDMTTLIQLHKILGRSSSMTTWRTWTTSTLSPCPGRDSQ